MPAPKRKPGEIDYFVLADEMDPIAGYRFWTDKDGRKRVSMHPSAAQYWIDQGALGTKPLEQLGEGAQHALKQMHRRGELPKAAPARNPDPNIPGLRPREPQGVDVVGGEKSSAPGAKFTRKK
jgi:hypothetical protein